MINMKMLGAAMFGLLLAAGCASYNGGYPYPYNRTYNISGTVDSVDLNSDSIYLTNARGDRGYSNLVPDGNGNDVRVFYNNGTVVYWQGRAYRPEDLDHGDQVTMRVNQAGNQFVADSMNVTYNSREGMASSSPPHGSSMSALSTIRGTIQYVDANTHTIALDSPVWISGPLTNPGTSMIIEWNPGSQISFQGHFHPVTNLQQGDVVDVQLQNLGGGNLLAQQISVHHGVNAH